MNLPPPSRMGNLLVKIIKIAPNSSLSTDLYPPPSKFEPERDMPDLTGKIILVTGGNTGIGYHTVKYLLLKNARVYLAARNKTKGEDAIQKLEKETGKQAIFLQLDLADLRSVRRAATSFLECESRLDVLFNNGGVMLPPLAEFTAQNQDLQFGTNVTGHYFLTQLLLPALSASYEATNVRARVINTSSSGYKVASPRTGIDFVSLEGGPERDAWLSKLSTSAAGWRLYGESKLGNILLSNYLARMHSDVLVSCALHPGSVRTDLQKTLPSWIQFLLDLSLPPASMGAYTQLWAGTTAEPENINGKYLIPWARIGQADTIASSRKLEDQMILWLKQKVEGF
ncbi:short-chain dehydrogenase/reductase family protein [Favolaschia claudopus]|uniref:Short-chain dehydrogenase/reductase family protein n=1 Tax=Favolaschia claudopus TaxID=2862362 RepID=A0AAW0AFE5_9AGAR